MTLAFGASRSGGLRAAGRSRQRPARREAANLSRVMLFFQMHLGWRFSTRLPDARPRIAAVLAASRAMDDLDEGALADLIAAPRPPAASLSTAGLKTVALVHQVIRRQTGLTLRANQVECALRLLDGDCVELRTGEGKTMAAGMAALAAAFVGVPVHVVTVNDYLVRRDHDLLAPMAARLGLTTAFVLQGMQDGEKMTAYDSDVVYGSNKTLVFDALRDRKEARDRKKRGVHRQMGQAFAIVDEADSVLIDDATVPMILSEPLAEAPPADIDLFRALVAFADSCVIGSDCARDAGGSWRLTVVGVDRLAHLAEDWPHPAARDDGLIALAETALAACHSFVLGVHYVVQDDAVVMIDQATGRLMPDRKWAYGMQQMIEIRLGITVTSETRTVGQITQQTFFRQYLHLAGLTGTARECRAEFWSIYRLAVRPVQPHAPSQLRDLGYHLHRRAAAKWQAVADRALAMAADRAVLIGVNDVAEASALRDVLQARGASDLRVLDALAEAQEAEIVAVAGQRGRITVATHLAGRGTDIALAPDVRAAGGLHVILASVFASARLDRQLIGRAGRQGDPGSYEVHISLQDRGLTDGIPPLRRLISRLALGLGLPARRVVAWVQASQDSRTRTMRRKALLREQDLAEKLGYK